jgi:Transmembrane secretion effector
LWRRPGFARFWLARAISLTGSGASLVAMPALMFDKTGSSVWTGALSAMQLSPYLLLGLPVGVWADRADRRKLMVGADLVCAAALVGVPAGAWTGRLSPVLLLLAALVVHSAFVVFDAAAFGAVPALTGPRHLAQGTAVVWATTTAVDVAGRALGGVLMGVAGATSAIGLDACTYAVSGLMLLGLPSALRHTAGKAVEDTVRQRLVEGLRFLRRQPLVWTLSVLTLGVSWTAGAVTALLVVYAAHALRIDAASPAFGVLSAAGAVGAVTAALVVPRWSARVPATRVALWSLTANTLSLPLLAAAPSYQLGVVTFALYEGTYTLITVNGITLRQRLTPPALQARVNTTARMIAWGGQPIGALTGGLLAQEVPVRMALLAAGTPLTVATVLAWCGRLRTESALAMEAAH